MFIGVEEEISKDKNILIVDEICDSGITLSQIILKFIYSGEYIMSNLVWVDPPSGWKYGWPKLYDKEANPDFYKWLIDNGYPQSIIDEFPDGLICGHWLPTLEEVDEYNRQLTNKV